MVCVSSCLGGGKWQTKKKYKMIGNDTVDGSVTFTTDGAEYTSSICK